MNRTSIEWTDYTWNPIRGCSRISEGCRHCYAEQVAGRFSKPGGSFEGFAILKGKEAHWTGKVELLGSDKLAEPIALDAQMRRARLFGETPGARVFVNSMSDLFHESLPRESILRVFDAMRLCDFLTFQVLTKRARRMREIVASMPPLPPFIHLGVSVEDEATATERIPELRGTHAFEKFISYEPALGPVDWQRHLNDASFAGVRWLIIGGETGKGARTFHVSWARAAIAAADVHGLYPFMKQWGDVVTPEPRVWTTTELLADFEPGPSFFTGRGLFEEWPPWARRREFPITFAHDLRMPL